LDVFVLCPGLHKQQDAPNLHGGEYPACAAMTTGYVFRVENPATVLFLQKIGRTGHLTTLEVTPPPISKAFSPQYKDLRALFDIDGVTVLSAAAYALAVSLSITALVLVILIQDWWALAVISTLMFARFLNVIVVRRRAVIGWKGASEPGVQGDLLILLSQDRWVRMKGAVDDLKAVTSGQWLREPTFVESSLVASATLLVYLDAALAGNARLESKILLIVLLFCSVGLLGVANACTEVLKMHGRLIKVRGAPKSYARRLVLAQELKEETGRDDWAIKLGMLKPEERGSVKAEGVVTM